MKVINPGVLNFCSQPVISVNNISYCCNPVTIPANNLPTFRELVFEKICWISAFLDSQDIDDRQSFYKITISTGTIGESSSRAGIPGTVF